MQKTMRTGAYERRTKAHETDDRDWLDWLHGLAKVRVASSNLVIRSRETPDERPFRGPLVASVVRPLYRFALPFFERSLAAGPENARGGLLWQHNEPLFRR
jgi:hypothetical protein